MTRSYPDKVTVRDTAAGCLCCCKCRSIFGVPASRKVTFGFVVLPSRRTEVDDFELVPLGLADRIPVADFEQDLDDASETRCRWKLAWLSPSVTVAACLVPKNTAIVTAIDPYTDGPGLPNVPAGLVDGSMHPVQWDWAWHYVFADTRPVDGPTGNLQQQVASDATTNGAWYGAVFDAVRLGSVLATFASPDPPTSYAGTGPLDGPTVWPAFDPQVVSRVGDRPPLDDGTIAVDSPFAGSTGADGSPYGWATGRRDTVQYVKVTNETAGGDPDPSPVYTDLLWIDTGFATTSVVGEGTTYTPAADAPVTRPRDVVFVWWMGDHTETHAAGGYYYGDPETAVACKCWPKAEGETVLDVTFVPARPGDGDYDPWDQTAEPDNRGPDLPGLGRSSSWRKLMGLRPWFWELTDTDPGRVQAVVANPNVFQEPLAGGGSDPWADTEPGGADGGVRCGRMLQLAAGLPAYTPGSYVPVAFSSYTDEGPAQFDFRLDYRSNYLTQAPFDAVPSLAVNGGGSRALGVTAVEGGATSRPLYPPVGAASGYDLTAGSASAFAVNGFTAGNPTPLSVPVVTGYFGIGPYRILLARQARTEEAKLRRFDAADTGTGKAAGGNGYYWHRWFDQPITVVGPEGVGSYEGFLVALSVKTVTLTSLDTGDTAVWEWVHAMTGSDTVTPIWAAGPGTRYEFRHTFTLTHDDFGLPTLPFGRYTIEAEFFADAGVDAAGAAVKTNYFVDATGNRNDHGVFPVVLETVSLFQNAVDPSTFQVQFNQV